MLSPSAFRLTVLAVIGVPLLILIARRFSMVSDVTVRLARARRERQRASRRERADLSTAAAYHQQLPAPDLTDALDERTWQDLDLDEVFGSLDYTESVPGRQFLYHLLRTPVSSPERLVRFERSVRRVMEDADTAERIRTTLSALDDPRAGQLIRLFFDELPPRPRGWWAFPLLAIASLACLATIYVWPRALFVWLAVCVINVGIQLVYKSRMKRFVPALHEVPAFVRVARALGGISTLPDAAPELERLRDGSAKLWSLRRASTWLMFEPGQTSDVVSSIYEYVNLLFLLDINAFVFATGSLRSTRDTMRGMFEAIGYLDAAQSVAAWRATLPRWTNPEFTQPHKSLHVDDVVHPLLTNPVANSLAVSDASILITGSNMSGKTTFVRTVGVNAILAQTLNTVCATAWRAPILCVRTSIGRADSIMEGKSYYLAEVESVRGLVRAKESGRQHLFLLDEIFRGTNTTERVAAAYAVLSYLDRGLDIVLVATHDIEVMQLLGDAYEAHHFREEITGGAMSFDYQIHAGPSSTRNAIALLESMEYPPELVADAVAALEWARGPAYRE